MTNIKQNKYNDYYKEIKALKLEWECFTATFCKNIPIVTNIMTGEIILYKRELNEQCFMYQGTKNILDKIEGYLERAKTSKIKLEVVKNDTHITYVKTLNEHYNQVDFLIMDINSVRSLIYSEYVEINYYNYPITNNKIYNNNYNYHIK